ncbi:ribonuclease HII [uncultured Nisaea sp.]|uniref:ribonuclease HII n=1 Tax=uncultured Nisaea sp. TaxID=538215 RepID=UPI0030ED99A9
MDAGAAQGAVIVGIDEVGRGPLAGPVMAAAVHIPLALHTDPLLRDVTDSKKLSAAKRELIAGALVGLVPHGIGVAEVEEIDRVNILQATYLAMARAAAALSSRLDSAPDLYLIDGNRLPPLPVPARAVVKGDLKSLSIAAASIIAKVHRDTAMRVLAEAHPGYGWERNAGYGTAEHLAGIAAFGVTDHHRRSFRPVREALFAGAGTP